MMWIINQFKRHPIKLGLLTAFFLIGFNFIKYAYWYSGTIVGDVEVHKIIFNKNMYQLSIGWKKIGYVDAGGQWLISKDYVFGNFYKEMDVKGERYRIFDYLTNEYKEINVATESYWVVNYKTNELKTFDQVEQFRTFLITKGLSDDGLLSGENVIRLQYHDRLYETNCPISWLNIYCKVTTPPQLVTRPEQSESRGKPNR